MEADLSDSSYKNYSKDKSFIQLNSLELIRLVRRHEVLYDSLIVGYNDKTKKDALWEQIIKKLYPLYDTYKPSLQKAIGVTVRRRWKTLRDSVSREVKRSVTLGNYARKKESAIISELEFLIPHIKSTHCAKLADELGLRECYSTAKVTDAEPQHEDSSYINNNNNTNNANNTNNTNDDNLNDLIDLTEECDIKPFIKQDSFEYDDMETGDESYPYSPQVNDEENGANNNTDAAQTAVETDESTQFCTVAQFKGGEFISPTELCANQEHGAVQHVSMEVEKVAECENTLNTIETNGKRARSMPEESVQQQQQSVHELQTKILRLLSSIENRDRTEYEANDEDRMFLLSLVSDLKRVPAANKMRIKMEIVTAIARATQ